MKTLKTLIPALRNSSKVIVDSLPSTGEYGVTYYIKSGYQLGNDVYEEYQWTGEGWEMLGNTDYTPSPEDVDTLFGDAGLKLA